MLPNFQLFCAILSDWTKIEQSYLPAWGGSFPRFISNMIRESTHILRNELVSTKQWLGEFSERKT